jgi:hypothetical protein
VVLEDHVVRQLPHLLEPLLGALALAPRGPRLIGRPDDASNQREEDQRRGEDCDAVASDELRRAVGEGVGAGRDGQLGEIPAQVFGELFDRLVPPLRLLPERLQDDVVEVALERLRVGCRPLFAAPALSNRPGRTLSLRPAGVCL